VKFFLITLLLACSLLAQDFSARYNVNVGMFGKVGYADLIVEENGSNYEAKLSAIVVGVAATLTGNRVETFVSKGKIIDGKYVPDSFIKTKTTTRKNRVQTYYFNHDKKEVKLVETKTKMISNSMFDIETLEMIYEDFNETSQEESVLYTYVGSDALSSYLNAQTICDKEQKNIKLMAVGAHNDENNVTLSCLEGLAKEVALLKFSDGIENIYNLHVEPHDKDDEIVDVLIAYDNDGFMKEAILGEVFWIGKITANRVYQNTTLQ
jgi:hypothetical protein